MSKKIYIAASSNELDRAERWQRNLNHAGIETTSGWIAKVRMYGGGNPPGASRGDCLHWATEDLRNVDDADILWVLLPDGRSDGAFTELGYAVAKQKQILTSGDNRSIFGSLTSHYPSDQEAFNELVEKHGKK